MLVMVGRSLVTGNGFGWQHYQALLADGHCAALLGRSISIAASAACVAMVLGSFQALMLARFRIPGQRFWQLMAVVPLCIPAHVHAVAWICLLGEKGLLAGIVPLPDIYRPLGVAFVLSLAYHPLVTLVVFSGLVSMDRRLEEAALQYHRPVAVLRRITLPLVWPHVMAGTVFVFIFAFFDYGVAALLRVHTYPVEIFAQFSALYNEAAATALSLPVIVAALLLLVCQRLWMGGRSYVVIDTGKRKAVRYGLGRMRVPAVAAMVLAVSLSTVLPLAVLAIRAGSWRVVSTTLSQLFLTVFLAAAASSAMVLLSWVLAQVRQASCGRARTILDISFYIPFAMPATVLAIGLIYIWNRPYLQWIYGTAAILVLAYVARFVPFSLQAVQSGLAQVGQSLRQAARLYQGSWVKRSWQIELPLCFPSLAAGWAIGFVLCMGELGATLLLVPPGLGTISLRIYTLMHYGAGQAVAALSLVLVLLNLSGAFFAFVSARRFGWSR